MIMMVSVCIDDRAIRIVLRVNNANVSEYKIYNCETKVIQ